MLDLSKLVIETPSWGYGDSGTRFGVFPQPGRPRDVFEKLDDAAEVHRLTGTAPAVAFHFPWDAVEDYDALRVGDRVARPARRRGQPEPLPGPRLQARLRHPPGRAGAREGRRAHARVPGDRDRARLERPVAVARRRHQLPGPGRPARSPQADDRLPPARLRRAPGRPGVPGRVQVLRARLLRDRPRRLGLRAADLLQARRAREGPGRPRPPRAGHEHRADRRLPGRRGAPGRVPLQQPQVRRRRPDRRLGQPLRAVPDLRRAVRVATSCRGSPSTSRTTSRRRSRR